MKLPYRFPSFQEEQERVNKLMQLSQEERDYRERLAAIPRRTDEQWRKLFISAWTTLIHTKPDGNPEELAEQAKKHADAALVHHKQRWADVQREVDRIVFEGETP